MAASIKHFKPYQNKHTRSYMGSQPKKKNTIGRCSHYKHTGALSVKMMKNHNCLGKQCPYFTKVETHPYWAMRALKKEAKKLAKNEKTA